MLNFGQKGEKKAQDYLKKKGFKIITCNFHSRFGEIDIIASDDKVLHFIEVKSSQNYDPIDRITPQKYKKLLKTIEFYLYTHPTDLPYQLDAMVVRKNVEWVQNITIF